LRQKFSVRRKGAILSGEAAANAAGVGKARKSAGVALFTPTSVLWALRIVATSSS
jgi:hypothetical protein